MIYLAKNEKGELERIQVCYLRRYKGSNSKWGALNHDGTKEIVPFDYDTYDSVLNILVKKYSDVKVSKRIVDHDSLHIVCFNKIYNIYDDEGRWSGFSSPTRISFTDCGYQKFESTQLPDYYENVEVVHKDKLWVGKDIDTGLWVCFQASGKTICQHHVKETCIHDSTRKLS